MNFDSCCKRAPKLFAAALAVSFLFVGGCERQSKGFALPPGDVEQGKVTFSELGCNHCHRIDGVIARLADSAYPEVDVRLGGQVSRVRTQGELVTAIIHPTRSLSRGDNEALVNAAGLSKMPSFNDRMTVSELIDLTTFLQQTYELYVPEYRPIYLP